MIRMLPPHEDTELSPASTAKRIPQLRVGLMTHSFPVISETFVTTLAAGLVEHGHDLRVLATDPAEPANAEAILAGHETLLGRVSRAGLIGHLSIAQISSLARGAPARTPFYAGLALADRIAPSRVAVTRMLAAEAPFDIVHAQFGYLGLTAMRHRYWGTLRTKSLVVHLRGFDITSYVEMHGPRVYERLFRGADLFIANCAHFRDKAVALGCPADKITVIGSPIDTAAFSPPAERHRCTTLRLVAVGRLVEKKGFADAIDAVGLLLKEGHDVRLTILGEGVLRPALESRIADAGLGDRVTLHGAATRRQVIAALHDADIALAPSVRAASGDEDANVNTAKEAMATGLPVIGTRHGGIPELVIPGENGDLVPERNPRALADAIARMINRPQDWHVLGAAGRRRVTTDFDRDHILKTTLDAYLEALDRAENRHE